MIAFGPDTDVLATPVQRLARRALVGGCAVLALGVISSVARLSIAPSTTEASTRRPRLVVDAAGISAMAADRAPAARQAAATADLIHDTPAVAVPPNRVVWMLVTAYCPCPKCCGKHAAGLTASGRPITDNYGHFVAAPASLPFGSKVTVPGYNGGRPVPVYDRGGLIKGNRLDVFFPTHDAARAWGRRWVAVTVAG